MKNYGDASHIIMMRHATCHGLLLALVFPDFHPILAIPIFFWTKSWRSSHAWIWLSLVYMESMLYLLFNKTDLVQF